MNIKIDSESVRDKVFNRYLNIHPFVYWQRKLKERLKPINIFLWLVFLPFTYMLPKTDHSTEDVFINGKEKRIHLKNFTFINGCFKREGYSIPDEALELGFIDAIRISIAGIQKFKRDHKNEKVFWRFGPFIDHTQKKKNLIRYRMLLMPKEVIALNIGEETSVYIDEYPL